MHPFISPLDPTYISLKRAAAFIAANHGGVEPDEIMDLLKYALFNEEFQMPQTDIHVTGNAEAWNLLLLRLEMPLRGNARVRLPIEHQPQEHCAVKAATVADVLLERDALPGSPEDWAAYAEFPRSPEIVEELHDLLANIPYRAFPARAHEILEDIRIAKAKLRAWMIFKGYDLPASRMCRRRRGLGYTWFIRRRPKAPRRPCGGDRPRPPGRGLKRSSERCMPPIQRLRAPCWLLMRINRRRANFTKRICRPWKRCNGA